MNYRERARLIANAYRLSVVNRGDLELEDLIADELKTVARIARQEGREREREKLENTSD